VTLAARRLADALAGAGAVGLAQRARAGEFIGENETLAVLLRDEGDRRARLGLQESALALRRIESSLKDGNYDEPSPRTKEISR
jgi:hypothetical protein